MTARAARPVGRTARRVEGRPVVLGDELMRLLESADSPIVQLALTDLVLRNGNQAQLDQLLYLANEERLHPDLIRHVKKALRSETI